VRATPACTLYGLRENICVLVVQIVVKDIAGTLGSRVRLRFSGLFAMEVLSRFDGLLDRLKGSRKPPGHVMYAHTFS
jgi:hypothetical protein